MTKVEELRECLEEHIEEFGTLAGDIKDDITDLISAAREEGAEQMKKRIWAGIKAQTYLFPDDIVPPLPESYGDALPVKEKP